MTRHYVFIWLNPDGGPEHPFHHWLVSALTLEDAFIKLTANGGLGGLIDEGTMLLVVSPAAVGDIPRRSTYKVVRNPMPLRLKEVI